jgi:hypothetical protein
MLGVRKANVRTQRLLADPESKEGLTCERSQEPWEQKMEVAEKAVEDDAEGAGRPLR